MRLVLEIDREALLTIGDQVRETVRNAALAGLQQAAEDFAGGLEDEGVGDGEDAAPDGQLDDTGAAQADADTNSR